MKSIVSQRFVECMEQLYDEKRIASYRQMAQNLEFAPQNLHDIRKHKRDAPIELIRKAIEVYKFNANYLFMGSGPRILKSDFSHDMNVLTIVSDAENNEKIVHVPVAAQAGYSNGFSDPKYISEMPCYSLPDLRYRSGSYRSFDVQGRSMEPSIEPNDRVICRFLEQKYWPSSIKNNHVYVIVTNTDVLVKRLKNEIKDFFRIQAISDNDYFDPYYIDIDEVKEVWLVETVIRAFDHYPSAMLTADKQMESQIPVSSDNVKPITSSKPRPFEGEAFDELMRGV